jgi:hypothetical protein
MQRADAEVEAVEHRVAGEQHANENEPDDVEIKVHGGERKALVVNDESLNPNDEIITNNRMTKPQSLGI